MSIFHNAALLGASGNQGAAAADYSITRSLRFNSADDAYLSRGSFANSDTKTMTFSFWLKRSALTATKATQYIFSGGDNGTIFFDSGNDDKLSFNLRGTSGTNFFTTTSAQLRDLSAWYHIVVALDLDNSTTSERFKCYINGVQQTMSNTSYPNNSFHDGGTWYIGSYTGSQHYPDYYLAEFHYVAGQALAASNFGEYDNNNIWNAKQYSGSYGTNGFYLNFSDNSSNSALGTDSSGNSNTWTVNNIVAAQFAPSHIATGGDPTSSTTNPFGVGQGHSVDFDGTDDQIRFTGPGTVIGDITIECFFRLGSGSGYQRIFSTKEDSYSSEQTIIRRHTNGNLQFYFGNGTPEQQGGSMSTNTWYHAAIVYDASADTVSYYIDGSRIGTDSYSGSVVITEMVVGGGYGSENWNGLISNCRVTKQALYSGTSYTVPTSTLTTTSQGAIAANVALLCCTTSTITAASGLAGDPADIDSVLDSPSNGTQTDSGAGGEVSGNYCVLNPLDALDQTLSDGNLKSTGNESTAGVTGTLGVSSGKWYWEMTAGSYIDIAGIWHDSVPIDGFPGSTSESYGYFGNGGLKLNSGSGSSYGDSFAEGDVIGVAMDLDNGNLYFYLNGTIQNSGTALATGLSGTYRPAIRAGRDDTAATNTVNFGQRAFKHAAPSGYKALCTANLSDSDYASIPEGAAAFDIFTENGTAGDRTFTMPGGFGADFVWSKSRNNNYNHALFDVVRTATKRLKTNSRDNEDTQANQLKSFTSTGFTYGSDVPNSSGETGVYWCWDAGTTTDTSNNDGSIQSTTRASTTNGFSIVKYQGSGSNDTVGHGLSSPPDWIIFKDINRDDEPWFSWHSILGNQAYLFLNTTAAVTTGQSDFMNSTSPTDDVFSVGNAAGKQNRSGSNFLALCWHNVPGFSSFGRINGNGNADGPFIYTGFRVAYVMIKPLYSYSGGSDIVANTGWYIYDSARSSINPAGDVLGADRDNDEENSATDIDLLSNGFKIRNVRAVNTTDDAVYMAFAEHPFKTSRAR